MVSNKHVTNPQLKQKSEGQPKIWFTEWLMISWFTYCLLVFFWNSTIYCWFWTGWIWTEFRLDRLETGEFGSTKLTNWGCSTCSCSQYVEQSTGISCPKLLATCKQTRRVDVCKVMQTWYIRDPPRNEPANRQMNDAKKMKKYISH